MWVRFVDTIGVGPGIDIKFLDPPQYSIGYCKHYTEFPKTGSKKKKVWTFKKENNTLQLFCDKEEIFNFNYMECNENTEECEECKQTNLFKVKQNLWSSENFAQIKFGGDVAGPEDNASDYYRPLPKSNC